MIEHKTEYELCVIPLCGLGNRLLVIASGLRLLNNGYYDRLRIEWDPTDELDSHPHELFMIDANFEYGRRFEEAPLLPLCSLPSGVRISKKNKLNVMHFAPFRSKDDDISADLTVSYKRAFKSLTFLPEFHAIADMIDVSKAIGIHCRRSDYWGGNHEEAARHHMSLDELFANYIELTYPDRTFFLASDSPYTIIYFEKRFGDRLKYYSKADYPQQHIRNNKCVRNSIVDIILLGRCEKIIADSNSTFSLSAAWLANKDKEIWKPI